MPPIGINFASTEGSSIIFQLVILFRVVELKCAPGIFYNILQFAKCTASSIDKLQQWSILVSVVMFSFK